MSGVFYDLNKLMEFGEFDTDGVKKNIGAEPVYFSALTEFVNNSDNYLSSYNPTVVIYGEEVRSQFTSEMNTVKELMLSLGIKESEMEISSLEEAIAGNSEKGLSDGLIKFNAKCKIISNHIIQAQMAAPPQADTRPVIFAVDDSPLTLNMLKELLGSSYKVIAITSGQEAVAVMEKYVPDVFLLDIEMPGMNGRQLADMIRRNNKLKHIPILFLTSSASRENVYAAKKLGVCDYILKPFQKNVLIQKINSHLQ